MAAASHGAPKILSRVIINNTTGAVPRLPHIVLAEDDPLILKGYGFHNAKELSDVICRFKFSDSKVVGKQALSVTQIHASPTQIRPLKQASI